MAAVGLLNEAPIAFEAASDVAMGGVLCALPALLGIGLLRHARKNFVLPEGFYALETIFVLLAFMALTRTKSLESLRYQAPGEWGKLLGLDRAPEVKTLRKKLGLLSADALRVREWSSALSREWMEEDPQSAGTLYIDGHVRVYHGALSELPRRYLSRERLCVRGTTEYWVNAMDGQPFFAVTRTADEKLLLVLENEIVPRLRNDVPGQPDEAALAADPLLHRFTIVFDREGYSPTFFAKMWEQRIAVLTYRKYRDEDWPLEEFQPRKVRLVNGEEVMMDLAERGRRLSNGMWVREVRHLDQSGHQTAMLSSDFKSDLGLVAAGLFARGGQENFFKYMRQHYAIDRLAEYGTEPLPETTPVINPDWRALGNQVRRERGQLKREQARFGGLELPEAAKPKEIEAHEFKRGAMLACIRAHREKLDALLAERKATPRHVLLKDLPPEERFDQLCTTRKHLLDTIKLIAYRAETALAVTAKEKLMREDDARVLLRQVLTSSADLIPDQERKILNVRLHRLSTAAHDAALLYLCEELTATETQFPGSDLRLVFSVVGSS